MFDRHLQKFTQKPLAFLGGMLLKKISANQVSLIGFIFGILMCICISLQLFSFALFFLILNRVCDGLDGVMARMTTPTHLGSYLDIVFDFIIYSGFVLVFGLFDTSNLLISSILLFSYICTGTTFLTQAIIQPKIDKFQNNESFDDEISKGFLYTAGLIEGTETILFMLLCLLFPDIFMFFGLIFSFLCLLTATSRIIIFYKKNNL
jgi:phosphatidylglycerophosphate synthase